MDKFQPKGFPESIGNTQSNMHYRMQIVGNRSRFIFVNRIESNQIDWNWNWNWATGGMTEPIIRIEIDDCCFDGDFRNGCPCGFDFDGGERSRSIRKLACLDNRQDESVIRGWLPVMHWKIVHRSCGGY
jgi:hypothetical protein